MGTELVGVGGAHRQHRYRRDHFHSKPGVCARRMISPISAAVHTFSHLSASIVLSRKRASEGLFPAIDPLQSSGS